MEPLIWIGIGVCVSQSATFSGLNLALFGVSRLRLEVEVASGNQAAARLLDLRKDSNFLLATILWGNVGANCLLTLLSESVLTGVAAFLFSTFIITILGEITPQAYFSRHALRVVALLSPALKFYQFVLYPIAKPSAVLLNAWLGREGVQYYREQDIREFIKRHIVAEEAEVGLTEGLGAINFLTFDDLAISDEGERIDQRSIIQLTSNNGKVVFPKFDRSASDPFVKQIQSSERKWVIFTDQDRQPIYALDADGFLRDVLFSDSDFKPYRYCHRPIIITHPQQRFGTILPKLNVESTHAEDDVIDKDTVVLWSDDKRIITGSDILGRLLRGIVKQTPRAKPAAG